MQTCEFCEISKNSFFTEHLWKTEHQENTCARVSFLIKLQTEHLCTSASEEIYIPFNAINEALKENN